MFERDRLDMVPLLTRLMAQGVDAIDLDGNAPATAGLIVKQARELGFKGLIIRSGGPATPEIIKVAGKQATAGMVVYAPIDRKSVGSGKRVAVRLDLGGRRVYKKNNNHTTYKTNT